MAKEDILSIFDQEYQRQGGDHASNGGGSGSLDSAGGAVNSGQYVNVDNGDHGNNSFMQMMQPRSAADSTTSSSSGFDQWSPTFSVDNINTGILLTEPSLILALAVLIEMLIPLSHRIKLSGLYELFSGLGRKVNRPSIAASQRAFAGIFLPALILLCLLTLVFILDVMSGFDTIVALVVLVLVLDLRTCQDGAVNVHRALHEGFKEKAKTLLNRMVLRETTMLSEMGIAKAAIESTVLRIFSDWFAVMIWYFMAGIEGAVLMQAVNLMTRAFNYKLKGNHQFGRYLFRLEQALLAVPALVLMLTLLFSKNPARAFACGKEGFSVYPAPISGFVLGAVGGALNISLGGPRYYQGNLIRLPKLGGSNNPDLQSILYAMRKIRMCGLLMLVFAILLDLNF